MTQGVDKRVPRRCNNNQKQHPRRPTGAPLRVPGLRLVIGRRGGPFETDRIDGIRIATSCISRRIDAIVRDHVRCQTFNIFVNSVTVMLS